MSRGLGDVYKRQALGGMGRSYEILGQESRAQEAWERAGHRPAAHLGLARLWLRRHFDGRREYDWREAAFKELNLAATGEPDDPSPALALFCEEKWEEALAASRLSRALRKADDVLHLAMGIAASRLRRWNQAVEFFDQALRLKPQSAAAYYHAGVGAEENGLRDDAAGYYEAALQIALPGWNHLDDTKARLDALR